MSAIGTGLNIMIYLAVEERFPGPRGRAKTPFSDKRMP